MSQISDDILDAALEEAFDKVPELNDCNEDEGDDYEAMVSLIICTNF